MNKYVPRVATQHNKVSNISDACSDMTDYDAIEFFRRHDGANSEQVYRKRCWIHTHPKYQAYMSHVDIYQMYHCFVHCKFSFCMVIFPRSKGLKVLAVRLTKTGTEEIKRYIDEANCLGVDPKGYAEDKINASSTKFYYQVPLLVIDTDECVVVDYREKDQVEYRLKRCAHRISEDFEDFSWL